MPGSLLEQTMISLQVFYEGRVQGVGFRFTVRHIAKGFDVTGWVRNRRDGSVEAIVAGANDAVEHIVAWAKRGPAHAVVTDVEVSDDSGNFAGFEMLPTV
jgi:acylphosphatase